jgi:hypothetical protein
MSVARWERSDRQLRLNKLFRLALDLVKIDRKLGKPKHNILERRGSQAARIMGRE